MNAFNSFPDSSEWEEQADRWLFFACFQFLSGFQLVVSALSHLSSLALNFQFLSGFQVVPSNEVWHITDIYAFQFLSGFQMGSECAAKMGVGFLFQFLSGFQGKS